MTRVDEYENPVFVVCPIVLFSLPMGKERKILRVCRHDILVGTPISIVKKKKDLSRAVIRREGILAKVSRDLFGWTTHNFPTSSLPSGSDGCAVSCATCFLWVDWAGVALFHVAPFGWVPDSCSEIFEVLTSDYHGQPAALPSQLHWPAVVTSKLNWAMRAASL